MFLQLLFKQQAGKILLDGEKGKTVFDTNFPDMAGIINELKISGHTKAELVLFSSDKSDMTRRNPGHTWSLVDKTELVEWMRKQVN